MAKKPQDITWNTKISGDNKCRVRIQAFPSVAQNKREKNSRNIQLINVINFLKLEQSNKAYSFLKSCICNILDLSPTETL